jgi:chromosome partitioning protein
MTLGYNDERVIMLITFASKKGGVGKTTSAFHLAAYLQTKAPTILVDGDPLESSLRWAARGAVPFTVVKKDEALRYARDTRYVHLVIDTKAAPDDKDLISLASGCDLLIIPTTPDALAVDGLLQTLDRIESVQGAHYKVLLTRVDRRSRSEERVRASLEKANIPTFIASIPELKAFEDAALAGLPVYKIDNPHADRAWDSYVALGEEIGL